MQRHVIRLHHHWANGVVVSRLICIEKVSGSNPDLSTFYFYLLKNQRIILLAHRLCNNPGECGMQHEDVDGSYRSQRLLTFLPASRHASRDSSTVRYHLILPAKSFTILFCVVLQFTFSNVQVNIFVQN